MRKPAIYVIGGGALGQNSLCWAKDVGLAPIVTDRDPLAPGLALAERSAVVDGCDVEAHLALARSLSHEFEIRAVTCGAEFGARVVQRLSEELGLERHDAAAIERALDKGALKRAFLERGVATPASRIVRTRADLARFLVEVGPDVILKPTRGSGSRGVQRVEAAGDLASLLRASLASVGGAGELVAERFVAGRSIDANGIFLGGCFLRCGVLEKFSGPEPEFLPIGGYDPARLSRAQTDAVYTLLESACRAVGIVEGPVKGDFVLEASGELSVLEVAARFHGDVTTANTLPFGSRINPMRFWFKHLVDGSLDRREIEPAEPAYGTWRVIAAPPGRVDGPLIARELKSSAPACGWWLRPLRSGTIPRYGDTSAIPGYAWAHGRDAAEAEAALEGFFVRLAPRIEPHAEHARWYGELGECIRRAGFSPRASGFQELRAERRSA
jgi:predicted ATP-grasp superfamily ATP-dependent carboligase